MTKDKWIKTLEKEQRNREGLGMYVLDSFNEEIANILAKHDEEIMKKHFEEIMEFINSSNRGNSDYFIVDQIENYIKENTKEKDELIENEMER